MPKRKRPTQKSEKAAWIHGNLAALAKLANHVEMLAGIHGYSNAVWELQNAQCAMNRANSSILKESL
jgi:hypothetical protein